MAKDYFRGKSIEFEDIDVSTDRAVAAEMVEKSGQMGVPVIDIDGEIIIGYDVPKIEDGEYEIGITITDQTTGSSKVISMKVAVGLVPEIIGAVAKAIMDKVMFGLNIAPQNEKRFTICGNSPNICFWGEKAMTIPFIFGLLPMVVITFVAYRLTRKRKYNRFYPIIVLIILFIFWPPIGI